MARGRVQQEKDGGGSTSRAGQKRSAKGHDGSETPSPLKKSRKASGSPASSQETRRARFLPKPNSAVKERISRAFTHRLYLIDKKLSGIPPSECDFFVLGATGNVYTVKLSIFPSCTCPDHAKGNICKHILFVMLRVLKLSREDHRVWQKALLPSELNQLLQSVPVSDAVLASNLVRQRFKQITGDSSVSATESPKAMQREIDGDCPVCYEPMASTDGKPLEPVVFCKTCGNNVHADCFKRWSQSKRHGTVTCIYCRAAWDSEGKPGTSAHGAGEYINLASYSDVHGPDETAAEVLYPASHQWWRRYR